MKPIKFSIIFLIIIFSLQFFGIHSIFAQDLPPNELLPGHNIQANPGVNPPANPGVNPPANPGSFDFPNPLAATTFSELITNIAKFLLNLALAFAFIMIIWAGFKFVTSGGNEEKLTSAKRNFTWTIIGIAIILAANALVTYIQEVLGVKEANKGTFQTFIDKITGTLDLVIVFFFSLTTVYFIWGVIQYVMGARGDDEKLDQGKRHMVWGIIGMAIMASAWGIVEIIKNYVT